MDRETALHADRQGYLAWRHSSAWKTWPSGQEQGHASSGHHVKSTCHAYGLHRQSFMSPNTATEKTPKLLPRINHILLTGKELRIYSIILWSNAQCWAERQYTHQASQFSVHDLSSRLEGSAEQTQVSLGHTFLLSPLMDRKASHSHRECYMHTERPSDAPMQTAHSLFVVQITTADEEEKDLFFRAQMAMTTAAFSWCFLHKPLNS